MNNRVPLSSNYKARASSTPDPNLCSIEVFISDEIAARIVRLEK